MSEHLKAAPEILTTWTRTNLNSDDATDFPKSIFWMLFPDRSPHLMREHQITWLTSRFFGFLTRKQNSLTANDVKRWRHFKQRHIHDTHAHNLQCTCEGHQLLEEFGLHLLSLCTMKIRQRSESLCSRFTSEWVRVARRNPLVIILSHTQYSPGTICTYITRSALEGSTNSQLKCFVAHNTLRPIYRAELENWTIRERNRIIVVLVQARKEVIPRLSYYFCILCPCTCFTQLGSPVQP